MASGSSGDRHHDKHHKDRHGNPADLEEYVSKMEDPSRAEWQKPDEVVRVLGLRKGQVAGDVGAGPGYFSLRLARAVGESGHVYAAEVEPRILTVLRERVRDSGARNLSPVLSLRDDALLPAAGCDLVLIVDTYHHFPDGPAYLRKLARALKPGGRIANVDFHKRELPVGPPPEHKVTREDFLADATAAGLRVVDEHEFLPYQYFVVLAPAAAGQR
jgi:ubiquinone/menaquinone biosynthesis C-methylase UbiE